MSMPSCEIGIIGLGTTGRNLLLNLAGQGYAIAGYDKDALKVQSLKSKCSEAYCAESLSDFISSLQVPRTVLVFAPGSSATESIIAGITHSLESGDLVIDCGSSHYRDMTRWNAALSEKGIQFLELGISGGEQGARNGPSIMVGGELASYERVRPFLEAAAARIDGQPCVSLVGSCSAGHYVKMVYSGIECGLMELIAESYGMLKQGLGLTADRISQVFEAWNREELGSYLLEITSLIFRQMDEKTGSPLIDVVLDKAKQKSPGRWCAQAAMDLDVPVPVVEMAIAMRAVSVSKGERETASGTLAGPKRTFQGDRKAFLENLSNALYAGMIITFAQGMAHLHKASQALDLDLNLSETARIWRGGSIIRAAVLKEISISFQERPNLVNLLLDPYLGQEVMARQTDLRTVVRTAADLGIPVAAFMAALSYYDAYRSEWLPIGLIQLQRDIIGADTYERTDASGSFHTRWYKD